MFTLFKKKAEPFVVSAPISGKLIDLADVNDEVFSEKMMGDGFAVIPAESKSIVSAPVSGVIEMVADTMHAVGIKNDDGVEILVHIGLDTVTLNGQGFKSFIKAGKRISRGDKMIEFAPEFMKEKGIDMTVMTIFTSGYDKDIVLDVAYNTQVAPNSVLLD